MSSSVVSFKHWTETTCAAAAAACRACHMITLPRVAPQDGIVFGRELLQALKAVGFVSSDPRLRTLRQFLRRRNGGGTKLTLELFKDCTADCREVVRKALTRDLIIPDFDDFCQTLRGIFERTLQFRDGAVASYIPQLATVDPECFAMAICTVDGQQFSLGDAENFFCVQSCAMPITYCMAVSEVRSRGCRAHMRARSRCRRSPQHGLDRVHKHVGREPSGDSFNSLSLKRVPRAPPRCPYLEPQASTASTASLPGDGAAALAASPPHASDGAVVAAGDAPDEPFIERIPHNPMLNSGAIMCGSLVRPSLPIADRLAHMQSVWSRLCGARVSINASVCVSERETADRNFCLAYMMNECKAFPPGTSLDKSLELYFQSCSLEVTSPQLAMAAASLANGGQNPCTADRVFEPLAVRYALSLMMSCGLYEYSGEWVRASRRLPPRAQTGPLTARCAAPVRHARARRQAFSVGLPAKSGVSGALMVVVPGICGLALYSPRLDKAGNSVRGVQFCKQLIELFNFVRHAAAPRRHGVRCSPLRARSTTLTTCAALRRP